MKAQYLSDLITPLTPEEAIEALRDGFRRVAGQEPSAETLACLASVSAHETGRWKALHRYGFGNVKASSGYEGHYTCYRLNEVLNGKVVWFNPDTDGFSVPPGHPQTRMRAFRTAADGAEDWLRFLVRRPRIWAAALVGDIVAVVQAQKAAGYFTASVESYLKAARWFFGHYLPLCKASLATPQIVEEPEPERSLLSDADVELLHVDIDWDALRAERDSAVSET